MKDQSIDWTQFVRRITIEKPIETVYTAWAVPVKLENWFLEKAVFVNEHGEPRKSDQLVQAGDRFIWKWHNHREEERGEITGANDADTLSFTFGAGGNVQVKLLENNGSTEVKLTQHGIPADEKSKMDVYVDGITGWTFWLTNLKAWLEHGITLHARSIGEEKVIDMING